MNSIRWEKQHLSINSVFILNATALRLQYSNIFVGQFRIIALTHKLSQIKNKHCYSVPGIGDVVNYS